MKGYVTPLASKKEDVLPSNRIIRHIQSLVFLLLLLFIILLFFISILLSLLILLSLFIFLSLLIFLLILTPTVTLGRGGGRRGGTPG